MPSPALARSLTDARLHVVTGKGGTGKTTVAAALALALTAQGRRVLPALLRGVFRFRSIVCHTATYAYPFTAPAVRPAIMCFWRKMNSRTMGSEPITANAIMPP